VGLDDVAELRVPIEQSELDHRVGTGSAEPGLLEQDLLLFGVNQPGDIDTGRHLVVGLQPRDLGVDEIRATLARQGDAMMSVLDEVGAADVKHRDWRHESVSERLVETGEAAA
jgi:hypothetical protein